MYSHYVDLSLTLEDGMPSYPAYWHPMVEISKMGRHGIENRETRRLVLGTHTGTHVDAPTHFIAGGTTIDQIDLHQLIGPATLFDLSFIQPEQGVSVSDLERVCAQQGIGSVEKRVLLRYDWDRYWGKMSYFIKYPYLTLDAAKWLLSQGVRLIAMDTPSPDDPRNGKDSRYDSPVHHLVLGAGVVMCEYLCGLKQISVNRFHVAILPLKIAAGDGAPARAVAMW